MVPATVLKSEAFLKTEKEATATVLKIYKSKPCYRIW